MLGNDPPVFGDAACLRLRSASILAMCTRSASMAALQSFSAFRILSLHCCCSCSCISIASSWELSWTGVDGCTGS